MQVTTLTKLGALRKLLRSQMGFLRFHMDQAQLDVSSTISSEMSNATTSINTAVTDLNTAAAGLGGIQQYMKEEIFTSNATWDWNNAGQPSAVWVTIYGSGGSGGNGTHASGGGGGGSGYYAKDRYIEVTGNVSITIGNQVSPHASGQTSSFGGHLSVGGGEWGQCDGWGRGGGQSHKAWQGGQGGNSGGGGSARHGGYEGWDGMSNPGMGEGAGTGGGNGDHPHSHGGGGGGGAGGYSIGDSTAAEPGHGHGHHHRGSGGRGGSGYGAGGGGGCERHSGTSAKGICIVKYWVDGTDYQQ
jgi:hypothetical protein